MIWCDVLGPIIDKRLEEEEKNKVYKLNKTKEPPPNVLSDEYIITILELNKNINKLLDTLIDKEVKKHEQYNQISKGKN